jgi:hypothetical protein
MQQPDGKQRQASPSRNGDIPLPSEWRELLSPPRRVAADERGVLGIFLEVLAEEGAHFARLEAAPVVLATVEHGHYARPAPMNSKHLLHSSLQPREQRLAATLLGLPQSQRKSRSYAHLGGHVGAALLVEMLDTTPCFLGGLAGLALSRGKSHQLNWHWQMESDGSQRLLPALPHSLVGVWFRPYRTVGWLHGFRCPRCLPSRAVRRWRPSRY